MSEVTAFWLLSCREGDAASRVLSIAPVGDYHRRRQLVLAGEALARFAAGLRLTPPQLDDAAGVGFLALAHSDPLRPWDLPACSVRRPLVACEGPCRRPYGAHALEGRAGGNLAALLGVTLSHVVESVEAHNLAAFSDATDDEREHGARRFLDGRDREGSRSSDGRRPLLVLGTAAGRALVAAAGGFRALAERFHSVVPLQHPSGRNLLLNDPAERRTLRRLILEALCIARGVRCPKEVHANIVADGHRPSWAVLRGLGVLAPSRQLLENWDRVGGGEDEVFERRYAEGRLVLSGPPWRLAAFRGEERIGRPEPLPVKSRASATLFAEQRARELGLLDAWTARDRLLTDQTLVGAAAAAAVGGRP